MVEEQLQTKMKKVDKRGKGEDKMGEGRKKKVDKFKKSCQKQERYEWERKDHT